MSKSQTICRNASPKRPFTQVCNDCLQNYSVSLEAHGFLVRFLAQPINWDASLDWARKRFDIGEQKAERIIKELIKHGYSRKRERERRVDGTWGPVLYEFTDVPFAFADADDTHALKVQAVAGHTVKNHPVDSHQVADHAVKNTLHKNKEETNKERQTPLRRHHPQIAGRHGGPGLCTGERRHGPASDLCRHDAPPRAGGALCGLRRFRELRGNGREPGAQTDQGNHARLRGAARHRHA